MSEIHSTVPNASAKPAKPYPEFPLFPHATKRWAKKIRGKFHYFGPWSDPDGALRRYLDQKDALHSGRKPQEVSGLITVKELANRFLNAKLQLQKCGELSPRTFADYKAAAVIVVHHFGKARLVSDLGPDDFAAMRNKLANKWGPVTLANCIQRIRVIFKYAFDAGLVERFVRYGPGFKRPSKKTLRLEKAKHGPKLFAASEVRRLLEAASGQLRAMIFLGLNCGYGNADCGTLKMSSLDLERGWIDFPRPKTGIPRRCPLWGETIEALKEVLAQRKPPKDRADCELVFLTKYGASWAKDIADSPITKETRKLLDQLGINSHRNFYTLRHTFRTVADEVKDQPAIDFIMGHESPHMSSTYREHLSDDRLMAVVEHVRGWLFPG